MPLNFNVPSYAYSLPWFMFDISNKQLITSNTIPGDILDKKDVILTETPIPGLNYSPVQPSGNGNRKITFTLPFIKRNNTIGNSLLISQFHVLRNQAAGLLKIRPTQFTPNPKVLYFWGTGSVPLIFFVKKCDLTHREKWVNQQGIPQFSEANFELWLDEANVVYKAEEMYRMASLITANALANFDTVEPFSKGRIF